MLQSPLMGAPIHSPQRPHHPTDGIHNGLLKAGHTPFLCELVTGITPLALIRRSYRLRPLQNSLTPHKTSRLNLLLVGLLSHGIPQQVQIQVCLIGVIGLPFTSTQG